MSDEIAVVDDEEDIAVPEHWQVTDLGGLEWCLEKLSAAAAQIAENEALGKQAIARLKVAIDKIALRVESINRPLASRATFFESKAKNYAMEHKDEFVQGKKKSRSFPAGSVGFRKSGGNLVLLDPAKAIAWAKRQPNALDLYAVEEKPILAALKAHCKATGEVPEGCELEPEIDEAFARPVKPTDLDLRVGTGAPLALPPADPKP